MAKRAARPWLEAPVQGDGGRTGNWRGPCRPYIGARATAFRPTAFLHPCGRERQSVRSRTRIVRGKRQAEAPENHRPARAATDTEQDVCGVRSRRGRVQASREGRSPQAGVCRVVCQSVTCGWTFGPARLFDAPRDPHRDCRSLPPAPVGSGRCVWPCLRGGAAQRQSPPPPLIVGRPAGHARNSTNSAEDTVTTMSVNRPSPLHSHRSAQKLGFDTSPPRSDDSCQPYVPDDEFRFTYIAQ